MPEMMFIAIAKVSIPCSSRIVASVQPNMLNNRRIEFSTPHKISNIPITLAAEDGGCSMITWLPKPVEI